MNASFPRIGTCSIPVVKYDCFESTDIERFYVTAKDIVVSETDLALMEAS